jgi:hypothetical protein
MLMFYMYKGTMYIFNIYLYIYKKTEGRRKKNQKKTERKKKYV